MLCRSDVALLSCCFQSLKIYQHCPALTARSHIEVSTRTPETAMNVAMNVRMHITISNEVQN